ncbi:hypothetical protein WN51_03943 [Melipona quadrifasciata]|uniref:PH domain-containing protein n=1 Tax=Melipona quadrifasciata TaxID=166423 RepID=A0A0M8ZPT8_9HYME|nr:hypothetical protein WN51_03943 [Melipona quadrifasciata]
MAFNAASIDNKTQELRIFDRSLYLKQSHIKHCGKNNDRLANSGGHVTRDESFAMDEQEEDDDEEEEEKEEEEEEGPYVCRGNLSRRVGSQVVHSRGPVDEHDGRVGAVGGGVTYIIVQYIRVQLVLLGGSSVKFIGEKWFSLNESGGLHCLSSRFTKGATTSESSIHRELKLKVNKNWLEDIPVTVNSQNSIKEKLYKSEGPTIVKIEICRQQNVYVPMFFFRFHDPKEKKVKMDNRQWISTVVEIWRRVRIRNVECGNLRIIFEFIIKKTARFVPQYLTNATRFKDNEPRKSNFSIRSPEYLVSPSVYDTFAINGASLQALEIILTTPYGALQWPGRTNANRLAGHGLNKQAQALTLRRVVGESAIAQYQTTPLLLEVYATPPCESRDPNQPIANFRCISVAPEEARFSESPPLKSLSNIFEQMNINTYFLLTTDNKQNTFSQNNPQCYEFHKIRWQRRWFVLYDDGELTYSVDEHATEDKHSEDVYYVCQHFDLTECHASWIS